MTCALPPETVTTLEEVRSTSPLDLEELIESLEADAANTWDATGSVDLVASRLLAVAHSLVGDHELAVPHARAAIDAEGAAPDAEMHFVLGVAAERRDEQDDALGHYDDAVTIDPKCWRALFHTGKIALAFGWPADAVGYFQQVAEINPSHAPTQAFLARLEEANIDLNAWQRGEDVDGDGGAAGEAASEAEAEDEVEPPAVPDLPDEMGDFKL